MHVNVYILTPWPHLSINKIHWSCASLLWPWYWNCVVCVHDIHTIGTTELCIPKNHGNFCYLRLWGVFSGHCDGRVIGKWHRSSPLKTTPPRASPKRPVGLEKGGNQNECLFCEHRHDLALDEFKDMGIRSPKTWSNPHLSMSFQKIFPYSSLQKFMAGENRITQNPFTWKGSMATPATPIRLGLSSPLTFRRQSPPFLEWR